MKKTVYILAIFLAIISCKRSNSENEWIKVKKTSSIEKYQDYLIKYPRTKYFSEIIDSLKIFQKRHAIKNWHHDYGGNSLFLTINKKGQLLFENELIDKNNLIDTIKYSILNPNNTEYLPEKKMININGLGDFLVSCARIEITADKELNNKKYAEIIELVKEAYIEIQNDYAINLYDKKISKLNQVQKYNIQKLVPFNIRFERYILAPDDIPPPPPKPSVHEKHKQDSIPQKDMN